MTLQQMTLQQLIDLYKPFGMSDNDIIKKYFIDNNLESEAINLLAELSEAKINKLQTKITLQSEWRSYCETILYNPVDTEKKLRLFQLVEILTFVRDLTPDEIEEVKKILKSEHFITCPMWLIGLIEPDGHEYEVALLNKVKEYRQ